MLLYVFRHGIAEPLQPGQTDADRKLTPQGVQRTRKAALGLARLADRPDAILTSPKLRAAQTAAILGEVFERAPATVPWLADEPAHAVVHELRQREEDTILIVGHEPTLSQTIAHLLTGRPQSADLQLKKAACAALDRADTPNAAQLLFLLPPKALRALA